MSLNAKSAAPSSDATRASNKSPTNRPTRADIERFDNLPDSGLVSVTTVAAVTDLGRSTIWRKSRTDPRLKPIVLDPGVTRFLVKGVREYMRGTVAAG